MKNLKKVFIGSSAIILFVTAGIKLFAVFSNVPYMTLNDPIFQFLNNRSMMLLAAFTELILGVFLLLRCSGFVKLWSLVWLALLFLSYRFGLWLIGFSSPCPCLGGAMNWLGMKPASADTVAKWIIGYFLVFGLVFLMVEWRQNKGIEQATKGGDRMTPTPNEN